MNRTISQNNNNTSLPPLLPPTSNQTNNMDTIDLDSSTRSRGVARNSSDSAKFHNRKSSGYGLTIDGKRSSKDDISIFLSPVRTKKNNTSSYFPPRSPFRSPRYTNSPAGGTAAMMKGSPSRRFGGPRNKARNEDGHDNDNVDRTEDILDGLFRDSSLRIHDAKKELQTDNMDSLSSMLENSRNGLFLDDSSDSESDEESSLGDDIEDDYQLDE